jgi:hypothetical protein
MLCVAYAKIILVASRPPQSVVEIKVLKGEICSGYAVHGTSLIRTPCINAIVNLEVNFYHVTPYY